MNIQLINPARLLSKQTISLCSLLLLLSACHNSDNNTVITPPPVPVPVIYHYTVTVTNLTTAQPMSPVAVMLHNDGHFWTIGSAASVALEHLAEAGDNSMLLVDPLVLASQSEDGVLMPSATASISVSITDNQPHFLSLATMLVNTNDGFTGIDAVDISQLSVGDELTFMTDTYDAGTEKNSELQSTIPGPVAGGEGFNSERDDVDVVAMHGGIVSHDDGLSQSVLSAANKFDNPTLSVTITRVE